MKKLNLYRKANIIFVVVISIIIVFIVFFPNGENFSRDWTVIEKWGVLQLEKMVSSHGGGLSIYDSKNKYIVVHNVKKYKKENQHMYVTVNRDTEGFREKYSITIKKNGKFDFLYFDTKEEMPTYAKINSETGDVWWYKEFSEMTAEDQKIFKELENK